MSKKKYRSVSLDPKHYAEFEQIAAEMTREDEEKVSVPKVIYRAKKLLKHDRESRKAKA